MLSCPPSVGSLPKTEDIDHLIARAMTTGHAADLAPLIVKKGADGTMTVKGLRSEVAVMLNAVVDMMNVTAIVVKGTVTVIETATGTGIAIVVALDTMIEIAIAKEPVIVTATVTATVTEVGTEIEIAIPAETMSVLVADVNEADTVVLEAVVEEAMEMAGRMAVCLEVQILGVVRLPKALYPYLKGLGNTPHGMSNLLVMQMCPPWKPKYQVHSCYLVKRDPHLKHPVGLSMEAMEALPAIWR